MNEADEKTFFENRDQFRLGALLTETPHPKTSALSDLAQNHLEQGFDLFQQIDLEALELLIKSHQPLSLLQKDVQKVLSSKKGRIFFCGCGATGRLSLTLERLWREGHAGSDQERVVSFMAGGDLALVKSIERFEDREDFGARQLIDLGFGPEDLLIAVTEGGETPFVIGAAEQAQKISTHAPYFLYCNPDDILCAHAERSKRVIENSQIKKINLTHGPQALSGSTRLQASTVLLLAGGVALMKEEVKKNLESFKELYRSWSYSDFSAFTCQEEAAIRGQKAVYYQGPDDLLISLFTDTTERSPTFSLAPFEHRDDRAQGPKICSWSYLVTDAQTPELAWEKIFKRRPRALEWPEVQTAAGEQRLLGHEFDAQVKQKRAAFFQGEYSIWLERSTQSLVWRSSAGSSCQFLINLPQGTDQMFFNLCEHLHVKTLLNAHSTLLMGRMGRYQDNVMTYVRPSNFKLIDRACRYADLLLKKQKIEIRPELLEKRCFELRKTLSSDDPIVLELVKAFSDQK